MSILQVLFEFGKGIFWCASPIIGCILIAAIIMIPAYAFGYRHEPIEPTEEVDYDR
jgi:hypothetical protein